MVTRTPLFLCVAASSTGTLDLDLSSRVHLGCFARVLSLSPPHHQTQNPATTSITFLNSGGRPTALRLQATQIHTTNNSFFRSIRPRKGQGIGSSCVTRFGFSFRTASCVPLATPGQCVLGFRLGAALVSSCQSCCLNQFVRQTSSRCVDSLTGCTGCTAWAGTAFNILGILAVLVVVCRLKGETRSSTLPPRTFHKFP
jgi:hypothetical protein